MSQKRIGNDIERRTLFAAITEEQKEAIRYIAFKEHKSVAEVAREAVDNLIIQRSKEYPTEIIVEEKL